MYMRVILQTNVVGQHTVQNTLIMEKHGDRNYYFSSHSSDVSKDQISKMSLVNLGAYVIFPKMRLAFRHLCLSQNKWLQILQFKELQKIAKNSTIHLYNLLHFKNWSTGIRSEFRTFVKLHCRDMRCCKSFKTHCYSFFKEHTV